MLVLLLITMFYSTNALIIAKSAMKTRTGNLKIQSADALLADAAEQVPKRNRYKSGVQNLSRYRETHIDREGFTAVCPTFEMTRLEAIAKLRKRMHLLIRKEGCDSRRGWVRAFERFHFHSGVIDDFRFHTIEGKPVDPFLPSGTSEKARTLLRRDLEQLEGMSQEAAARVASTISGDAQRMTKTLVARFGKQAREGVPQDGAQQKIEVIRNRHNDHISLRLGSSSGVKAAYQQQDYRVHSLSGAHEAKLRQLWNAHSRDERHAGGAERDSDNDNDNDDTRFYRDCFSLLTRMHALEGKGYQAGSPTAVYEELHRSFGVTAEMFASPLNCYFPDGYFSAFTDTDSPFGSCGSFYDLDRTWDDTAGGSFVGNPPFVQFGLLRAAQITHTLIARADAAAKSKGKDSPPLSFILIVPAWGLPDSDSDSSSLASSFYGCDSEGSGMEGDPYEYIMGHAPGADLHMPVLLSHPHARASMIIRAEEHCYVDGHQHHFTPPPPGATDPDPDPNLEPEPEPEIDTKREAETEAPCGDGTGSAVERRKVTWQEASQGSGSGSGRGSDYYRPVAFDTAVVVIQNDAGARKWPFTKQKENRLRRIWGEVSAKHTTAAASKYVPKAKR